MQCFAKNVPYEFIFTICVTFITRAHFKFIFFHDNKGKIAFGHFSFTTQAYITK